MRFGISSNSFRIALFTLFSLLSSCTPKDQIPAKLAAHKIDAEENEFPFLMNTAEARCEDSSPENCPPGAALLVIRGKMNGEVSLGQCSGFLIDERTVMTNSHCLPEEIRHSGNSCSGKIKFVFPKSGSFESESSECETVLSASQIKNKGESGFGIDPDYAVLSLKSSVVRPAFRISRDGISDGMAGRVLALDPASAFRIVGVLRVKTCRAIQRSMLIPSFVHDFNEVATFTDCDIISGNSGSALIDKDGKVRGIMYAKIDGYKSDGNETLPAVSFSPMSMGTNAACVQIPLEVSNGLSSTHTLCSSKVSADQLTTMESNRHLPEAFESSFKSWNMTADSVFEYQLEKIPHQEGANLAYAYPKIKCIRQDQVTVSTNLNPGTAILKVKFPIVSWFLDFTLDSLYRLKPHEKQTPVIETTVTLDFNQKNEKGEIEAKMDDAEMGDALEWSIPICSS